MNKLPKSTKEYIREQMLFYLSKWNVPEDLKEEQVKSFIRGLETTLQVEYLSKEKLKIKGDK